MQGRALIPRAHRIACRFRLACFVCLVGSILFAMIVSARAQDAETCDVSRPVIEIDVPGSVLAPVTRAHLLTELRAAVARWGLNLCPGDRASREPLAQVRIDKSSDGVGISARDLSTDKVVIRDVDLSGLPEDVHGVAVALAVEELLKASWLELALREDGEVSSHQEAQHLRAAVDEELSRPRHRPLSLGARGALDVYSEGAIMAGADLLLSHHARRPFGVQVSVGIRQGVDEEARHGRIEARSLTAEPAAFVRALSRDSFTLLFPLAASVSWVTFNGVANEGEIGRSRSGLAVALLGSATGLIHLGARASLWVAVAAGPVVRGMAAQDQGKTATALAGWTGRAELGLTVRL